MPGVIVVPGVIVCVLCVYTGRLEVCRSVYWSSFSLLFIVTSAIERRPANTTLAVSPHIKESLKARIK